jgi:hypothetical protein
LHSCGEMNSGGSDMTLLWRGATMVAERNE